MKELFITLIVLLMLSSTPLLSQPLGDSTRIVSFQFLREVLKRVAELEELKKNVANDSIYRVNMELTYAALQASLGQCQEAIKQSDVISAADARLLQKATKEVGNLKRQLRVQKFVKWLGWGVAVLVGYLAVTN